MISLDLPSHGVTCLLAMQNDWFDVRILVLTSETI